MNLIGYTIGGHHNGTNMFDDTSSLATCPSCGFRLKFSAHNLDYRQERKRRSDLLCTYDGDYIVTVAFRDFCVDHHYDNAQCLEFNEDHNHFHLVVEEPVLPFDAVRRKTKFIGFCPVCRNYREVIGATPAFLLVRRRLVDGFYCTDLRFASGNSKRALVIIGFETKTRMLEAGLKGILFKEVYGLDAV